MSELSDEIRALTELIAAAPDAVADLGAEVVALYRQERQRAIDEAFVAAFLHGPDVVGEDNPLLVAVREKLRDRLKSLLAWAKASGRV